MYLNRNVISVLCAGLFLTGCSAGFLGLAPAGDRKEYIHARDLYNEGKYQQAVVELSQYIYKTKNVKRREVRAYRLLGRSYEQLAQMDKALEVYLEALEFHPKNVPLLLAAADLYYRTDLIDRSISLYEKVLSQEPNNQEALAGQAANYISLGFYSKARVFYDRFFELNPQAGAVYRARYADTFLKQRDYERAFTNITLALSEEGKNPDFWLVSAKARRGLNQPKEALEDLETALRLAPTRQDLLEHKALWLYEGKKYRESLEIARQILLLEEDSQLVSFIMAMNEYQLGNLILAREHMEKAWLSNPASFIGKTAKQLLETYPK